MLRWVDRRSLRLVSSANLDAAWNWGGANGSPVQLWDYYGSAQLNQRWRWLCNANPPTPCQS
jgi:hypothetical protein